MSAVEAKSANPPDGRRRKHYPPLTPDQQRLADMSVKLAEQAASIVLKRYPRVRATLTREECLSSAYLGLCLAIAMHSGREDDRVPFSIFARTMSIHNILRDSASCGKFTHRCTSFEDGPASRSKSGRHLETLDVVRNCRDVSSNIHCDPPTSVESSREALSIIMAVLPPRSADIWRRYMEGSTFREIAEDLGVTHQAVTEMFRRSVSRVRKLALLHRRDIYDLIRSSVPSSSWDIQSDLRKWKNRAGAK